MAEKGEAKKPKGEAKKPESARVTIGNRVYILQEKLGHGAFSWCCKAEVKSTGETVALKFTKRSQGSARMRQRQEVEFRNELYTFMKVRHKNVVKLFDFGEDVNYSHANGQRASCFCMALELCGGGELFDIVYYTGKLDERTGRTIMKQIVSGLSAMHRAGVCHRDIKPQNILLTDNFEVKIADFGSSQSFNQRLMQTHRVGTRGYQAPELLLRRGYTLKCDIFSLGVLLFTCLTRHAPFQSAVGEDKYFNQIAKRKYAQFWKYHHRDRELSEDVKDLFVKMCCYQPQNRLTIEEVAAHKWFQGKTWEDDQFKKLMKARGQNAASARIFDVARCPDNYNSFENRGEVDVVLMDLPESTFAFYAVEEHPWKICEYLNQKLMVEDKLCKSTLFRDLCGVNLTSEVRRNLGYVDKTTNKPAKEDLSITAVIRGWKHGFDKYALTISVTPILGEESDAFRSLILGSLGLEEKVFDVADNEEYQKLLEELEDDK